MASKSHPHTYPNPYEHLIGKRVRIVGAHTADNIGLEGIYEKPERLGYGHWVLVDVDGHQLPYLGGSLQPVCFPEFSYSE